MYVVYRVVCLPNSKCYVGYTRKTTAQRFGTHLANARWARKGALYDAMRRYGEDAFVAHPLQHCANHAEACQKEREYIRFFASLAPSGYNLALGGDGVPLTPAQIAAAAAKKRGKFTDKQRAAADRRKGRKVSDTARANMSAAGRGRKQNPEWVAKRTEAVKRAWAARLGRPGTKEPTRKKTPPRKRVWTPELRQKERERALAQWTPEAREAARARAEAQWTTEARQQARDRILRRYAERRGGVE